MQAEIGGKHADHLMVLASQLHYAADDLRIASKRGAPQPVTQECHGCCARAIVISENRASKKRPDAEELEEACFHEAYVDGPHAVCDADNVVVSHGQREPLERPAPFAVVEQIERVQDREGLRAVAEVVPDDADALLRLVWQRLREHPADHREHRRVRADAERERANGHEREPGALAEPTQRCTHVLPHAVDRANPPDVTRLVEGEHDVAERAPARVCGVLWRKAVTLQRVLTQRAVRFDLLLQIGVMTRPAEGVP